MGANTFYRLAGWIAFWAFLLGLCCGLASCRTAEAAPVPDIPIAWLWRAPPMVYVCPGAPGGLKRWEKAVAVTAKHGARWAGVAAHTCEADAIVTGAIYVATLGDSPEYEDDVGHTQPIFVEYPVIDAAVIAVKPWAAATHAPEHELLHAAGLGHHTMTESILNGVLSRGSWDWSGVEEAFGRAWEGR